MRYLPLLLCLVLAGCGPSIGNHYESGYVCSCEQRKAVADYVRNAQQNGMSDNAEDYIDEVYAVAVRTNCDHRDSVLVSEYGKCAIGLEPCEIWHQDYFPIQP